MSILIKGMEMPKNCDNCWFFNGDSARAPQCCLTAEFLPIPIGVPTERCPLVPVPPHGDLIDRDKLETHHGWYNEDRERNVVQTHIQFVYANAILTAPVVLESED